MVVHEKSRQNTTHFYDLPVALFWTLIMDTWHRSGVHRNIFWCSECKP